jgi:3-carboxy-cis,cis-muconate cycloisomerase
MFASPAILRIFAGEAFVRQMLVFEAALARAEGRVGVIPAADAEAIATAAESANLDVERIFAESARAGTPAIPLVKYLTAEVPGDAKRYVHWGATSQDPIDTAMVLQAREALDILEGDLQRLAQACSRHAEQQRETVMIGRTLQQHALPITFGLKAARWLALLTRQLVELRRLHEVISVAQLGGAAGTLASLSDQGPAVVAALAEELGLADPGLPWHTERDRVGALAAGLGVLAGSLAKIATDVSLMTQTDLGEVTEAVEAGKGGSSAMPHKRNPVDVIMAVSATKLALAQVPLVLGAMAQEHERAAGGWQAEWAALPALFAYTGGALERVLGSVAGLEIHPDAMRRNLELTRGLPLAESLTTQLGLAIGRPQAYALVQAACERAVAEDSDLLPVCLADQAIAAHLSADQITQALDPAGYLGATQHFIDRALADYRALED